MTLIKVFHIFLSVCIQCYLCMEYPGVLSKILTSVKEMSSCTFPQQLKYIDFLFLLYFFFNCQDGLTMQSWLARNLLCRPG